MGNDFSADSDCVALWDFENSGNIGEDSIGSNDLTNSGTAFTTEDAVIGSRGIYFNGADRLYISDSNLDSGFPLKNGASNVKFSVCFWRYVTAFPSSGTRHMMNKFGTNKNSFTIQTTKDGVWKVEFGIGYNSGASMEYVRTTNGLSAGIWYHFGITYDDSDKSYRVRIWNRTTGAIFEEITGNFTNNIHISDADFDLGYNGNYPLGGYEDEVAFFKDVLTADEIDEIRQGIYNSSVNVFSGDSNCVAMYDFESSANLGDDHFGNNDLTNSGVTWAACHKRGVSSARHDNLTDTLYRTDVNLSNSFPLKSGGIYSDISVCFWFNVVGYPASDDRYILFKDASFYVAMKLDTIWTLRFGIDNDGLGWDEEVDHGYEISAANWYHVGITHQNSDKAYRIRIWDDLSGALLGEVTGNTSGTINKSSNTLYVGKSGNSLGRFMDELVFFNDILTADEIDEIRQGLYGESVDLASLGDFFLVM